MKSIGKIIAAVQTDEDFEIALKSNVKTIFFLSGDIMELKYLAQKAHKHEKKLFIHLDLTTGLGKDKSGIEFAKLAGIDGILSTRTNLIKAARECGLDTVQRFFIVDSHSIDTTIESLKASKSDMIEVMPGVAPKIIKRLKSRTDATIIVGGLIDEMDEVKIAIESGACAISTSDKNLWDEQI